MKKAVIVYYSSTGNTQMMADAIAEVLSNQNMPHELYSVSDTNAEAIKDADLFFLGCPAMGVEELEEYEFRPFFDDLKASLVGKPVVLFGSYDWGDGSWIEAWEQECVDSGALVLGRYTAELTPEEDVLVPMKEEIADKLKNLS